MTSIILTIAVLLLLFGIFLYFYMEVFKYKEMRNIKLFKWIIEFLEWAKIIYKPTQFYLSNKTQARHKDVKSIGAGKVYVFSNKVKEIYKLQKKLEISDMHLRDKNGYPCLEIMGSKIGKIKLKSEYKMSIPFNEIFKLLKKQRSDKV